MLRKMFLVFGLLFTGALVWGDINDDTMAFLKIFSQASKKFEKLGGNDITEFKYILSQEFQKSIKEGEITKDALTSVVNIHCNGQDANMVAIKEALSQAIQKLENEQAANVSKEEPSQVAQQGGGTAGGGEAADEKTANALQEESPHELTVPVNGEQLYNVLFTTNKNSSS